MSTEEVRGRLGLVFRDSLPWPQCRQIVETAEETGYEAVFVPEIAGREAFSTLTGFAAATGRIALGTGVVTIWSRRPATTAMAAASVQDISAGRHILGIGAGAPQGADQEAPARSIGSIGLVRAYVDTVRTILAGAEVPPGDVFGAAGFRLGFEPDGGPPLIWLAALGDRMIALAGEVADGVILNWCTPERVAEARTIVAEAISRAGRDPKRFTVAVYVRACLGVEEAVALEALRAMTGVYASIAHYRAQFERMGLGDLAGQAAAAAEAGEVGRVPEPLVRALTVLGGRREAMERFEAYRDAGADLVLCYPVAALDPFSSVLGTVLVAAPNPAVER